MTRPPSPSSPPGPESRPDPEVPAFYVRGGDGAHRTYTTTEAAQGPWDPLAQHGGPPAALLGSVAEGLDPGPGAMRVARVSVDFLGPLPMGELAVRASVPRPGARIQLAQAELLHKDAPVAVARVWRHRVDEPGGPVTASPPAPALPGPDGTRDRSFLDGFGYGRAMEWRVTSGFPDRPGPCGVWMRARRPLVEGEPTSGLARMLLAADSANGASLELPLDAWLSVPTSLNVTVLRYPEGEWVHMDARTHLAGDGIGLTEAVLSDERGRLAIVTQSLLVAARS